MRTRSKRDFQASALNAHRRRMALWEMLQSVFRFTLSGTIRRILLAVFLFSHSNCGDSIRNSDSEWPAFIRKSQICKFKKSTFPESDNRARHLALTVGRLLSPVSWHTLSNLKWNESICLIGFSRRTEEFARPTIRFRSNQCFSIAVRSDTSENSPLDYIRVQGGFLFQSKVKSFGWFRKAKIGARELGLQANGQFVSLSVRHRLSWSFSRL